MGMYPEYPPCQGVSVQNALFFFLSNPLLTMLIIPHALSFYCLQIPSVLINDNAIDLSPRRSTLFPAFSVSTTQTIIQPLFKAQLNALLSNLACKLVIVKLRLIHATAGVSAGAPSYPIPQLPRQTSVTSAAMWHRGPQRP